jgi:multicomponent Na+:H+ antiporter subunit F
MIDVVTTVAVSVLEVCIIMAAYRVIALNVIAVNTVGLILVLDVESGSHAYVDAALVIGLLSFLGTVSLAQYLSGGTVIDRGDH